MLIITPGMIKSFYECPKKYKLLYSEKITMPSADNFAEAGKNIHSFINYKLNGFDTSPFDIIFDKPENKHLKLLADNFLSLNITNVEKSEYAFFVRFKDDIFITGRLDALRKIKTDYEIIDWKTGSSSNTIPENNIQTAVYLFAVYNLLKNDKKIDNYQNLSMTYFFLKENKSETIGLSEQRYNDYRKIIDKFSDDINIHNISKSIQNKNCKDCSYSLICRGAYGREIDVL